MWDGQCGREDRDIPTASRTTRMYCWLCVLLESPTLLSMRCLDRSLQLQKLQLQYSCALTLRFLCSSVPLILCSSAPLMCVYLQDSKRASPQAAALLRTYSALIGCFRGVDRLFREAAAVLCTYVRLRRMIDRSPSHTATHYTLCTPHVASLLSVCPSFFLSFISHWSVYQLLGARR